jgi:hypothetical protein
MEGVRPARGPPKRAVDPSQHEGPTVRGPGPALTIGTDGLSGGRRQAPWWWRSMAQQQTSCRLYGMEWTRILFYQRLARGLCFFMKNSG